MKFNNTQVFNISGAIRGMRNAKNSWKNSDSYYDDDLYVLGENDIKLAQALISAGTDHSKFMRQITLSVDITAPIYWWKEFDTYKVGTVSNSTSTMHTLATTEIKPDCFEFDSLKPEEAIEICQVLERYRLSYLSTQDKYFWRALIQLLPSAWLQTRTITMSYQNVSAMCIARKGHKLTEWSYDFMDWAKSLPYAKELIMHKIK